MRKNHDREGFKTCPRCKLELPLTVTYFGFHSVTRKPTSYCRKCAIANTKRNSLIRPHGEALCGNCKAKFVYPLSDKSKGKFCSNKCHLNFIKHDDTDRLEQLGLRDLNETHHQKDY